MPRSLSNPLILLWILFSLSSCHETPEGQTGDVPNIPEIDLISDQLKADPTQVDLWLARATMLYEVGSFEAAISDLTQVIQLDSHRVESWHLLADVYLDYYQSRLALQTMERAAALFDSNPNTLLKLAEFQLILRQHQAAQATLDRIEEIDPRNGELHFMHGMVAKDVGDTLASIAHFQKATSIEPQLIDAWINLGQLFASVDAPEAIRYFNAAESIQPDNITLLHAKAMHQVETGAINQALQTYRILISHDPFYADAYYNMGILYLQQDSLAKAVQHFELAVKTEPEYARAYYYLGLIAELSGQADEAILQYQQSQAIDPDQTDVSEALERLKQALR